MYSKLKLFIDSHYDRNTSSISGNEGRDSNQNESKEREEEDKEGEEEGNSENKAQNYDENYSKDLVITAKNYEKLF